MEEKRFEIMDYEVGQSDYGMFETFEAAKDYAENLKTKLCKDFSVIEYDENGNGTEIWTTK